MVNAGFVFGGIAQGVGEGLVARGKVMREERLAQRKTDEAATQREFTAGENEKDRDSRMGLLKQQGVQALEIKQAGIASQMALLKEKLTHTTGENQKDRRMKLEMQIADLQGKWDRMDATLTSQEDIAGMKDDTVRRGQDITQENVGAKITSAEKIAGIKITSAEKIAQLNIDAKDKETQDRIKADVDKMRLKFKHDKALLDKKIEAAEKEQKNNNAEHMKRLKKEIESREKQLDEKIAGQKWLQGKEIESKEREGAANRQAKKDIAGLNAAVELTTNPPSDAAGNPIPAGTVGSSFQSNRNAVAGKKSDPAAQAQAAIDRINASNLPKDEKKKRTDAIRAKLAQLQK